MQHLRRLACAALALMMASSLAPAAWASFPQLKINYIDVSQAPRIRIFASVASKGFKPPGDKDLLGVKVLKKPEKGQAVELFGFQEGELVWPKSLSDAEKKEKETKMAPELAFAAELDKGSAIVVVVPGFQDPEYRNGTLGERSRNGSALFFKKLGKTNVMNAIWYNDYVWSYVYTDGRTNGLTRLEPELDKCAKWERDQLPNWGLSEEELLEKMGPPPEKGPRKNEARCGLHADYGELGKYIQKSSYDGFWPQLFGLVQRFCVKPEHAMKQTGLAAETSETGDKRLVAMDAALEMLVKGGEPGMPKILILTGDGRDGYINAAPDCRQKYLVDCQAQDDIKALKGKAQRDALNTCIQDQLEKDIRIEQAAFVEKLPHWLGLAKGANIRIYSVIHPTAPPYARERLEVLAWRTGGTARVARDANEVVDHYDSLITELNNQIVVTFVDEEATPNAELAYIIEANGHIGEDRGPGEPLAVASATSEPFAVVVPPAIERSTINEFKSFGESKLGKVGFMAALIGVALILLIILVKLGKKLFKGSAEKATKAAKKGGGKGKDPKADKAKAKAIEKAKKAKEAQKKAMAKAKKG